MFGFRITGVAITPISNNSQTKPECWVYNWESPGSSFWEQPWDVAAHGRSRADGVCTAVLKFLRFCYFKSLFWGLLSQPRLSQPGLKGRSPFWLPTSPADTQWRHWGQGIITVAKAENWEKMEEKYKIWHEHQDWRRFSFLGSYFMIDLILYLEKGSSKWSFSCCWAWVFAGASLLHLPKCFHKNGRNLNYYLSDLLSDLIKKGSNITEVGHR